MIHGEQTRAKRKTRQKQEEMKGGKKKEQRSDEADREGNTEESRHFNLTGLTWEDFGSVL